MRRNSACHDAAHARRGEGGSRDCKSHRCHATFRRYPSISWGRVRREGYLGFSTGRSDRPETDREVEKRRNSRERDLRNRAQESQQPTEALLATQTAAHKDRRWRPARAPPSVLAAGSTRSAFCFAGTWRQFKQEPTERSQQQQQQQPFGLISTVCRFGKEKIGKLKV